MAAKDKNPEKEVTAIGLAAPVLAAILRPPPFHLARPRGGVRLAHAERSADVSQKIVQAIRKARVGGTFWEDQYRGRPFRTLIRIRSTKHLSEPHLLGKMDETCLIWHPGRHASGGVKARVQNGAGWITGAIDPWSLIAQASDIIADSDDEVALLAACADKPVYALSDGSRIDRDALLRRLQTWICAYDYSDPYMGDPITVSDWIDILADWRRLIDENRTIGTVMGIRGWKRPALKSFLWTNPAVKFGGSVSAVSAAAGKAVAHWPSRTPPHVLKALSEAGISTVQVEDGFIRSVGLGAHLHLPRSLVVDFEGVYYDPRQPSTLERLLNEAAFDDRLLTRAKRLITALQTANITKYAAGEGLPVVLPSQGRRILVPGQVDDDLSVRLGGAGLHSNIDFLARVRMAEPAAYIIYKPHPDVVAGLRSGHVPEREANQYADVVLPHVSMAALLNQVDAVHVLTSLAGFEALIRGREVVTHGQPFYAGWGLTRDLAPRLQRRQRVLSLPELVAAALILYPRYLDPVTNLPCSPEVLIERHSGKNLRSNKSFLNRARHLQGDLSVLGRVLREMLA